MQSDILKSLLEKVGELQLALGNPPSKAGTTESGDPQATTAESMAGDREALLAKVQDMQTLLQNAPIGLQATTSVNPTSVPGRATTRSTDEPGSVFAAVLDIVSSRFVGWNIRITIEAFLITFVSVYVAQGIGLPQAGLVAVLLASAAIVPKLNSILATNRERIWAEAGSGRRVNRDSTISVLGLFTGMFLAFLVVAILTDLQSIELYFGFILEQMQLQEWKGQEISAERFQLGSSVLGHNLSVLSVLAVLAFLYRSLGAMIALGWNASVWAITLTTMAKSGVEEAINPAIYTLTIILAITPHVLVEAGAYLVGALAGIFLSRGCTLYGLSDPRLRRVLAAVLLLAVVSVVLVLVGGLIEINYAPRILQLIN